MLERLFTSIGTVSLRGGVSDPGWSHGGVGHRAVVTGASSDRRGHHPRTRLPGGDGGTAIDGEIVKRKTTRTVETLRHAPAGGSGGGFGSVAVGTMHLAKGLQFRAVAVAPCDEEVHPRT